MKLKNHILVSILLLVNVNVFAQSRKQKKADDLFNNFSFVNALKNYQDLLNGNYNADYSTRQLADCYAYLRNPDSAAVYYKKVVEQINAPIEYFYKYAQSLRGIKNYNESRVWLKRFKDAGGDIDNTELLKDADFITSIFNAKQQYFLSEVPFNSKHSDFGAYEHGGNIYFTSSRDEGVSIKHILGWDGQPFLDIYVTKKESHDSIINNKSKIKGDINSIYHDGPLTITNDGKTMYFSRNNFNKDVLKKDSKGISNLKIYRATLIDGLWTNLEDLTFNNDAYSTEHPALNSDGTKLYFASDMPGGIGAFDIYFVDINSDGSMGAPQNLGSVVNTDQNELFPFINNEGSLFFSSDGYLGLGLLDIFGTVSDKNNNIESVINLGAPINSSKDDFSFFMEADGLTGYIASNRDGSVGSDDIYAYHRIPPLLVEGTVIDSINNLPIKNVVVTLYDANDKQIAYVETNEDGHYNINIDRGTNYKIVASQDTYADNIISFTSNNLEATIKSITPNFVLNPVAKKIVPIIELYPIYFDFNKFDIRSDGTVELDRIVNLMMNVYPNMVIKIESHTDSNGSSGYNDILSLKRAKATYQYLISKGVYPSRITSHEGFGEQKLVNGCDGTINCKEDEHQLNRRTQFIVVKME